MSLEMELINLLQHRFGFWFMDGAKARFSHADVSIWIYSDIPKRSARKPIEFWKPEGFIQRFERSRLVNCIVCADTVFIIEGIDEPLVDAAKAGFFEDRKLMMVGDGLNSCHRGVHL